MAMLMPMAIERMFGGALDANYEFETLEGLKNYASTSPLSYSGQILYCKENDTLYKVNNDKTDVASLGSGGGEDAVIPYIGDNGNWYVNENDTGVPATGQDGMSAYEVAVAFNGFEGTEEEWLESLKGADGIDGYSPTVVENANNTEDNYKLDITDANGTFTTPNLVGRQGVQGIQGEAGKDGEDGTTYTPSIGEVTTVDSNELASATVSVNTETKEAVFNFAIPKGADGSVKDNNIKTYCLLSQLGITTPCTIKDIWDKMPSGSVVIVDADSSIVTDLDVIRIALGISDGDEVYGILTVVKLEQRTTIEFRRARTNRAMIPDTFIGYCKGSDCTLIQWREDVDLTDVTDTIDINSSGTKIPNVKAIYDDVIEGKIIDQTVIDTYGTEILKYPLGIWRIDRGTIADKFSDLPVKTMCGRIEITSINSNINENPWNSNWGYRAFNFESHNGTNYFRKLNSEYGAGIKHDTGWQKVCGTTVEDVGVTTITPVNSNITGNIEYEVKNGICYVSMKDLMSTISSTNLLISTTMPKPSINCTASSVTAGGNIAMIYIDKNTTNLRGNFYTKNAKSHCSFSYPVAEN